MKRTLTTLAAAMLALAPVTMTTAQSDPGVEGDPILDVDAEDVRMNAAKAQAQATLGEWLAVLEEQPAYYGDIAFKYPLDGWEHIWVDNVSRDGDALEGTLANNPHSQGYAFGQRVRVPLSQVSDWSYRDDRGVVHGHRTTVVLFDQMPPEAVAEIKRAFGWE